MFMLQARPAVVAAAKFATAVTWLVLITTAVTWLNMPRPYQEGGEAPPSSPTEQPPPVESACETSPGDTMSDETHCVSESEHPGTRSGSGSDHESFRSAASDPESGPLWSRTRPATQTPGAAAVSLTPAISKARPATRTPGAAAVSLSLAIGKARPAWRTPGAAAAVTQTSDPEDQPADGRGSDPAVALTPRSATSDHEGQLAQPTRRGRGTKRRRGGDPTPRTVLDRVMASTDMPNSSFIEFAVPSHQPFDVPRFCRSFGDIFNCRCKTRGRRGELLINIWAPTEEACQYMADYLKKIMNADLQQPQVPDASRRTGRTFTDWSKDTSTIFGAIESITLISCGQRFLLRYKTSTAWDLWTNQE